MAKQKSPYYEGYKKNPNKLKALCGVQREWKYSEGYFPVLRLTHEDVMRVYEYSKYMRAKGKPYVQIEMYKKKRKGTIKYTLAVAIEDKREIVRGSTFDKLTIIFDPDRDNDEVEPYMTREFRNPIVPGYKLRKEVDKTLDAVKREVRPKRPAPKKRKLGRFDQLVADSIAPEEPEIEPQVVEPDPEPVQEPEIDVEQDDDSYYD